MDAEVLGAGVGTVEHDVVGPEKATLGQDLEAQSEDVAAVHGVGVWIVDLEGGDGAADTVE